MITLIVFSIFFAMNTSASAVAIDPSQCDHCGVTLRGAPELDKDVAKIARAVAVDH